MKQDIVNNLFVISDPGIKFVRQGKNIVIVSHWQQLSATSLQPSGFIERLAFRAMPVAAGVVDRMFIAAEVAFIQMPAEHSRPADLNVAHYF